MVGVVCLECGKCSMLYVCEECIKSNKEVWDEDVLALSWGLKILSMHHKCCAAIEDVYYAKGSRFCIDVSTVNDVSGYENFVIETLKALGWKYDQIWSYML